MASRDCLARAGWTRGRRIDIAPQLRQLEAEGYTVFEAVRDFLARFGGLRLTYPHFRVPEHDDSCHFDAAEAAGRVSKHTVQRYTETIGKPVCPIGAAFHDHMVLMMTEQGVVYAAFEGALVRIADSGVEAINSLCEGRDDHDEIPLPHWNDDPESLSEGETGSSLDELLARAVGPTGPATSVDLGMPGPFADLSSLLTRCNGFTAFSGVVQVYRAGEPGAGPELWSWNEQGTWKDAYGSLADNLFCFGQGPFGEQYAFDLANHCVVEFDPETGQKTFVGSGLKEWADEIFDDFGVTGWEPLVKSYQEIHGPLAADQRLVPIRAFADGGEYELENLAASGSLKAMRSRGAAALQRSRS
jgi:hypothetical protein